MKIAEQKIISQLEHGPTKLNSPRKFQQSYYRSITIVQSDTGKYHELELVAPNYYECAARVIIPLATNE